MARPTDYKNEYVKQALVACKLGARDLDLAEMFGVQLRTIGLWKVKHPEFKKATEASKQVADANVERSLYERACGYTCTETDIKVIDGEIVTTDVVKQYPPDTAAAFIWLKNRKSKEWRHNPEEENKPPEDRNITINLVDAKKPDAD